MTSRHSLVAWLAVWLLCVPAGRTQESSKQITFDELRTTSGSRVWVYLPADASANVKLPCVVIPPAGSRMFHGLNLGKGDIPEHTPWAQAGFAVISFDISGPWDETNRTSVQQKALTDFMNAKLGVKDALSAIELVRAKYGQIDPARLYVVGHSSAGTLALQLVAATNKFKACVAFAPVTDLDDALKKVLPILDRSVPGFANVIHAGSPMNRVEEIQCPVFLFHAADDDRVTAQSVEAYRDALLAQHKTVQYVAVETGGHHDSMIKEGIPKAIAWVKGIDQQPSKP